MPRIAVAQIRPAKADYAANLDRVDGVLRQVAGGEPRIDLVVFAETVMSGYFVEGGVREVAVTAGTLARDLAAVHVAAGGPAVDVAIGFYEVFQHRLYNSCLYATLDAGAMAPPASWAGLDCRQPYSIHCPGVSVHMKKIHFKKVAGLSRRYQLSLLIGALVVIAGGALLGRDNQLSVDTTSPRLVRAYTVASAGGDSMEYTGVIHARTESDLAFRVSGKIIEKLVKAGDHVKRGQALMRLDPTDLRLAANAAQSAVEAARAQNKRAIADELRQRGLVAMKAVSVQEARPACLSQLVRRTPHRLEQNIGHLQACRAVRNNIGAAQQARVAAGDQDQVWAPWRAVSLFDPCP